MIQELQNLCQSGQEGDKHSFTTCSRVSPGFKNSKRIDPNTAAYTIVRHGRTKKKDRRAEKRGERRESRADRMERAGERGNGISEREEEREKEGERGREGEGRKLSNIVQEGDKHSLKTCSRVSLGF